MIPCNAARGRFEDALRGRLGGTDREELDRHLAGCRACVEAFGRIERQARAVATAGAVEVPARLRGRVVAMLGRRPGRPWKAALAGAVAAGLLVAGAFSLLIRPGDDPLVTLTREAVGDHIRVVLRQRAAASPPEDPSTLQAVMGRVLDFPVPLPYAGNGGYRLVGGRPSYVLNREVACFYYRTSSSLATLFVLPAERLGGLRERFPPSPQLRREGKYGMAFWQRGALAYFLVSDASPEEILRLAEAIRRA